MYLFMYLIFFKSRILAIANHVQGNMPYAKWGLPTKDTDVTALRGTEGNGVMKVFLDIIISLSLESDLSLYKIAPRI